MFPKRILRHITGQTLWPHPLMGLNHYLHPTSGFRWTGIYSSDMCGTSAQALRTKPLSPWSWHSEVGKQKMNKEIQSDRSFKKGYGEN